MAFTKNEESAIQYAASLLKREAEQPKENTFLKMMKEKRESKAKALKTVSSSLNKISEEKFLKQIKEQGFTQIKPGQYKNEKTGTVIVFQPTAQLFFIKNKYNEVKQNWMPISDSVKVSIALSKNP